VSLSIGTVVFVFMMVALIVVTAFLVMPLHVSKPVPYSLPRRSDIGELEKVLNELKYGPVNMDAAREEKHGLFDRLRARRQQARCVPTQAAIEPSDCNYYRPVVTREVVTIAAPAPPPAVVEYPIANPLAVVVEQPVDCADCKVVSARDEPKTGAFACSNCRNSQITDWHTEWKEDGTPVTFLCVACYRAMTPSQRLSAFNAYRIRQIKSAGSMICQETAQ